MIRIRLLDSELERIDVAHRDVTLQVARVAPQLLGLLTVDVAGQVEVLDCHGSGEGGANDRFNGAAMVEEVRAGRRPKSRGVARKLGWHGSVVIQGGDVPKR